MRTLQCDVRQCVCWQSIHQMLSPLPPEDLKRAELQSYLNPYPLARAMGGLGMDSHPLPLTPAQYPSSPAFLSKATLLSLRTSLEGSIAQSSGCDEAMDTSSRPNQAPHQPATSFIFPPVSKISSVRSTQQFSWFCSASVLIAKPHFICQET